MRLLILLSLLIPALLLGCIGGQNTDKGAGNISNGGEIMKNQTQGTLVAAKGDTVQVDYIGKLENGTVFDTSIAAEAKKAGLPLRDKYDFLEFKVGAGQMISGFDSAVVGMREGEVKTVRLAPSEAYGERDEARVLSIPIDKIGNSGDIKAGSVLYAQNGASATVIEVKDGVAKVDFNHELAGKPLVFTITMVKVIKK